MSTYEWPRDYPPPPTLEKGSGCGKQHRMALVMLLQRLLSMASAARNGCFSDLTHWYLTKFQEAKGLDPSGIVDPQTWDELLPKRTDTDAFTRSCWANVGGDKSIKTRMSPASYYGWKIAALPLVAVNGGWLAKIVQPHVGALVTPGQPLWAKGNDVPGFRSSAQQKAQWDANQARALPPGYSAHEHGMALDVARHLRASPPAPWVQPYPEERWHFEIESSLSELQKCVSGSHQKTTP